VPVVGVVGGVVVWAVARAMGNARHAARIVYLFTLFSLVIKLYTVFADLENCRRNKSAKNIYSWRTKLINHQVDAFIFAFLTKYANKDSP
jgi:uncharacterized membrane protein YuzA (DUF378 family)